MNIYICIYMMIYTVSCGAWPVVRGVVQHASSATAEFM